MRTPDVNTEVLKKQIAGTDSTTLSTFSSAYEVTNGCVMSIEPGNAINYAQMRAHQLSGLLHLITGEGYESFKLYSDDIQGNVHWLASSLAGEMVHLFALVHEDAKRVNAAKGGK